MRAEKVGLIVVLFIQDVSILGLIRVPQIRVISSGTSTVRGICFSKLFREQAFAHDGLLLIQLEQEPVRGAKGFRPIFTIYKTGSPAVLLDFAGDVKSAFFFVSCDHALAQSPPLPATPG